MFSKLKIIIGVLIVIFVTNNSKANKGNDSLFVPHKHIFKWRVLEPAVDLIFIKQSQSKRLSLSYESVVKLKQSFCLNAEYVYGISHLAVGNDYTNSYSNGFVFYPEYRIYLNRKKIFPTGFHFGIMGGIGYSFGENTINVGGANPYYLNNSSYVWAPTSVIKSKFSITTIGLGVKIGIQYFIGKRRQFTMDHSIAFYGNKNIIVTEESRIDDNYRMYPINRINQSIDLSWTIGYAFGNYEPKTHEPESVEEHKWSIAIHAAPAGAKWYSNQENKKLYPYQNPPKLGFIGGISGQYNVKSRFALRVEANYERKGTMLISTGYIQSNGYKVTTLKYNYSLDYISIPVMVKFIFNKTKFNLFANTGVSLGYLIKFKSHLYPNEYTTGNEKVWTFENLNRLDVGLLMGLGLDIPLNERILFSTEVRNNFGVTNIYKNVNYFKNETFALLLGVCYKL